MNNTELVNVDSSSRFPFTMRTDLQTDRQSQTQLITLLTHRLLSASVKI